MSIERLSLQSGPSAQRRVNDATVLVQPIGALEHHGPHLPLGTDALIAEAFADALAGSVTSAEIEVLPTISYGLSTEHIWAPGTFTLSPATLSALLDDLAVSAVRLGVTRFAFLNTHGGNTHLLRVVCRELRARHDLMTFLVVPFLPPDNGGPAGDPAEGGFGIHGHAAETSVMRYLHPELVEMSLATRSIPTFLREFEHIGFGRTAEFSWLSKDLSESGVIGDPTLATGELGKQLFTDGVDHVLAALEDIARFSFPAR